ncbi:MAG: DUF4395 domain-containing protein [Candidatus Dormibacteria bacterium]
MNTVPLRGRPNALISFPNPVNEVASRTVAAGVALVILLSLVLQIPWMSAILAYGFLARVTTGPKLSPLGQFATRWAAPRLARSPKLVPGPPKRFAQAIGATLTVAATICWFAFHLTLLTYVLLGAVLVAATLEASLAFCLGCTIFSWLMALGVIPRSVCEECADISARRVAATGNAGRTDL